MPTKEILNREHVKVHCAEGQILGILVFNQSIHAHNTKNGQKLFVER